MSQEEKAFTDLFLSGLDHFLERTPQDVRYVADFVQRLYQSPRRNEILNTLDRIVSIIKMGDQSIRGKNREKYEHILSFLATVPLRFNEIRETEQAAESMMGLKRR